MKKYLVVLGCLVVGIFLWPQDVSALSLRVTPLEYRTELAKGEIKKGFIDISNPSAEKMIIKTSVQSFRQTDDIGSVQFFDSEQLSEGIRLDLDEFELGPREAVRMYFLIDGKKLPTGDVFGGIFFTTGPAKATIGTGQSVKLGTLLSIVNGTPGSRKAEVKAIKLPSFQFDTKIHGSYIIKNTGDSQTSTGFYPKVNLSLSPFGEKRSQTSKLVFAGRTRENTFTVNAPPFGFYNVKVAYGDSVQSKWIFIAHPGALAIAIIILAIAIAFLRIYRRHFLSPRKTIASK